MPLRNVRSLQLPELNFMLPNAQKQRLNKNKWDLYSLSNGRKRHFWRGSGAHEFLFKLAEHRSFLLVDSACSLDVLILGDRGLATEWTSWTLRRACPSVRGDGTGPFPAWATQAAAAEGGSEALWSAVAARCQDGAASGRPPPRVRDVGARKSSEHEGCSRFGLQQRNSTFHRVLLEFQDDTWKRRSRVCFNLPRTMSSIPHVCPARRRGLLGSLTV